MAPKEPKISTQTDAGTTRHITLTIPETFEIIMKPGSATCQCHNGSIQQWIVGYPNIRKKLPFRN